FAVSALLFDYVLTGPISGVSAGLYLAGLINELAEYFHHPALKVNPPLFATGLAAVATIYFWRKNIIGVHESSQKALRIMQLTTVMVVTLIIWCLVTMAVKGFQPVPLPSFANLKLGEAALGWRNGTGHERIFFVAIMVGLGHSLLAMSGEETLAQVNREIASPKLKNLERTGFVIFIYSLLFTSLVSFFAVMIIPDSARPAFLDNLIGGLSMFLVGPEWARLIFHIFVVVVGTVLLSGAVNTAIIGSNGVLNRVAEDGVLPDSLRHLHPKFGTTHRMVNLIVGLQLLTLLLTRGDILLLGEAYAFGVVTSFAMKSLSVLLLRFKMPEGREWKVPGNFRIGTVEIPVGLGFITLVLFLLAAVNLVTKKYATILGLGFTLFFFAIFIISHKIHLRGQVGKKKEIEKFRLEESDDIATQAVTARPGCVLVAVRNPFLLDHVRKVLEKTDTRKLDIIIMTVKRVSSAGSGEHDLTAEQVFSTDIAELFSRVVSLAEKAGKHVELLVVPGNEANLAIVETAERLKASLIVMGLSGKLTPDEQAKAFGD
ncbi:MAG: amino acid permease, partial [Acidobacteria bacterium]|nr:amino acid permease [Acidobacteriota bacterium]